MPLPVSVKKVSKEPALSEAFESGSKRPSALSPCSRRYLESFVAQSLLVKKAVKDRMDIQFPSTVPKLGTGLADVKMAHLQEIVRQPLPLPGAFFEM